LINYIFKSIIFKDKPTTKSVLINWTTGKLYYLAT